MVASVQQVTDGDHRRIPALDGIRGFAVLLVLGHHMAQSVMGEFRYDNYFVRFLQTGWSGVDLFLVLSGFLITGILYDSKHSGSYFRNFYARRALRIFPLYYLALLVFMVFKAALPETGLYGDQSQGWMWIYATNFVIAAEGFGAFGILDHFWTLAIEEHFYLVWPFVVYALDRRKLLIVSLLICAGAGALRLACVYKGISTEAVYVLTFTRIDSMAAGAWIALMARGRNGLEPLCRPAMVVGAGSLCALAMIIAYTRRTYHDTALMQSVGHSLIYLAFGSLIVLSQCRRLFSGAFKIGVLRWFGKYSYGMYVWHPVIFFTVMHTAWGRDFRGGDQPVHQLLAIATCFAAMIAVSMASWHLWEKHFLKLKKRF